MSFTIGSLFDGSGGFPLAAILCGGTPRWGSEIEPYPIAVTRNRIPGMKHLGDISKINGAEVEPVDVISFGSPCQDLSVAGKRAGLKHEANGDEETTRSGLFMEAVRIIKEMREATHGKYPRFALWENVPGAFSSNKGEDFRIVLEELIKIVEPTALMPAVPKKGWAYADSYVGDGWSIAYRVFDAQYWGVPQRRRRIYLVLDLGGECAGEVLFKRDGLRGYFAQGGSPWQGAAADAEGSVGAADSEKINCYGLQRQLGGVEAQEELAPTILVAAGESGNNKPCVAYGISSYDSNAMKTANPHSGIYEANTSRTLDLNGGNPACNQGGIAIVEPVTFEPGVAKREGGHVYEGVAGTLRANAGDNQLAVAFAQNQRDEIRDLGDKAGALQAQPGMKQQTFVAIPNLLLDDQGGQQISIRTDEKCPTLRAEAHGNVPCVVESAGFKAGQGPKARSIGWEKEKSPTLAANAGGNTVPAVAYSIENHPADSRVNIDTSGKVQTLTSRMGTGETQEPPPKQLLVPRDHKSLSTSSLSGPLGPWPP